MERWEGVDEVDGEMEKRPRLVVLESTERVLIALKCEQWSAVLGLDHQKMAQVCPCFDHSPFSRECLNQNERLERRDKDLNRDIELRYIHAS